MYDDGTCISWACMYSLPLLPFIYISLTLGLSAILPKHGCHFKQLLIYISKSTKYFDILLLLACEEVPPFTYCPNLSSKFLYLKPKQPSNSLPFFHSDWSQKTFFWHLMRTTVSGISSQLLVFRGDLPTVINYHQTWAPLSSDPI